MFDPAALISGLPHQPGVYRMLNAKGDVLYVGKAGDLRKRVSTYFQKSDHGPRIQLMLAQVDAVEITVTRSEAEALILENNLIKSLAPRYNILFRDDKSYPYLVVTGDRFPRIGFHRGPLDRKHAYFGPFANAGAVRESIQLLQKVFRLRTCEDSVFQNRSRPCLLHQIRRCSAPCVGLIDAARYAQDVNDARLFMEGREDDVVGALAARMQEAAERLDYEQAAIYRDQLRSLARVQTRQYVDTAKALDADVVACAIDSGIACVNLAMIRNGRYLGDKSFFPQHAEDRSAPEVIGAFLAQHYLQEPPPALIVTAEGVDAEELAAPLAENAGRAVQIVTRPHAERRAWLEMAQRNATGGAGAAGAGAGHPGGAARGDARGARTAAVGAAHRMLRRQPYSRRSDRRLLRGLRSIPDAQLRVPALQRLRRHAGRRLRGHARRAAAPIRANGARGGRGAGPDPDRRRQGPAARGAGGPRRARIRGHRARGRRERARAQARPRGARAR